MSGVEEIREYWDADAATYDRSDSHHPSTRLQRAAWRGALAGLVGDGGGQRVLDVGAGTGFLSLLLAEMGHDVTAVDMSAQMLQHLKDKAAAAETPVTTIEAEATDVPDGPFDVVVSRHLMWLLPDPVAALQTWHRVASSGRLLLVDAQWGKSASQGEKVRRAGRRAITRWRKTPPAHHAELPDDVRARLPLGHGPGPAELLDVLHATDWSAPRLHRLAAVEWAMADELPYPERVLGVSPRFAIVAGS